MKTFYLAYCTPCGIKLPFETAEARNNWAATHVEADHPEVAIRVNGHVIEGAVVTMWKEIR